MCGSEKTPVEHISIDSRTMKGNDLFVPLIGEKVDAHRFISQAIGNGAVAVLTSEHECAEKVAGGKLDVSGGATAIAAENPGRAFAEPPGAVPAWIRVEDTTRALQAIGKYYRQRLHLPLIGVTGSVGKTTTREMISAALAAKYRVYKTPGNHNSQVGVPITLSEITSQDEVGVIELGMSEPGELTVIAQIAQVDMAVITNIGVTHIEQLGSKENIYREKLSIQDGLKPGGILFLNGDDELLKKTKARDGFTTVYYGTEETCDYRAEEIHLVDGYPVFTAVHREKKVPVSLRVMGRHQILNAMVALAVAESMGVPMEAAAGSLGEFTGFDNRQQIYRLDGITCIDDTYNASPVSMKAAIDILSTIKGERPFGRRIAVLADMKELGEDAPEFHREIGEYLAQKPVDILAAYGELASEIAGAAETVSAAEAQRHIMAARQNGKGTITVKRFQDKQKLEEWLDQTLTAGDIVLFKGSNSMKLGEVVEHVRQHHH